MSLNHVVESYGSSQCFIKWASARPSKVYINSWYQLISYTYFTTSTIQVDQTTPKVYSKVIQAVRECTKEM